MWHRIRGYRNIWMVVGPFVVGEDVVLAAEPAETDAPPFGDAITIVIHHWERLEYLNLFSGRIGGCLAQRPQSILAGLLLGAAPVCCERVHWRSVDRIGFLRPLQLSGGSRHARHV